MYKENYGNIPNKDKVNYYLIEDNKNRGPWVARSKLIGKTSKMIGEKIGLDPDIGYACGSLFEIGKKENKKELENTLRSFYILRRETYFFPAKISITSKFIIKDINSFVGENNIIENDQKILKNLLKSYTYTDYDKLIQLLDNVIIDDYVGIDKKQEYLKEKYKEIPFEKERIKLLREYQKYFEKKLKETIEYYIEKNKKIIK